MIESEDKSVFTPTATNCDTCISTFTKTATITVPIHVAPALGMAMNSTIAKVEGWLVLYTNPPRNYVGTTIFLLYIIAALTLTAYLVWDVVKDQRIKRYNTSRGVNLCLLSSLLIFLVSSFNMITFLYHHFVIWYQQSNIHSSDPRYLHPGLPWRWMLESTFFMDFGDQLVEDGFAWWWTLVALEGAFKLSAMMGSEAVKNEIGLKKLAAYFALAQILPPGLACSLFSLRSNLDRLFEAPETQDQASNELAETHSGTQDEAPGEKIPQSDDEEKKWEEVKTDDNLREPNSDPQRDSHQQEQPVPPAPSRSKDVKTCFDSLLWIFVVLLINFNNPLAIKYVTNTYQGSYATKALLSIVVIFTARLTLFAPIADIYNIRRKARADSIANMAKQYGLAGSRISGQFIMITVCSSISLLIDYRWNLNFVIGRLLTTFVRNDAVRTLMMDRVFGGFGVEKYGLLELKRVEERILSAVRGEKAHYGNQDMKDSVRSYSPM